MSNFQQAPPRHQSFHCGHYWHMKEGAWLRIYDFIGALTAGGDRPFFTSIQRMAEFLCIEYEYARRVVKKMRAHGWLEKRGDGHLYFIPHAVWAKKHPGLCCQRVLQSWQIFEEADPIVGQIYAISGGKVRLYEGHIKGIRKVVDSGNEQEFLDALKVGWAQAQRDKKEGRHEGTSFKTVLWKIVKEFKQLPVGAPV